MKKTLKMAFTAGMLLTLGACGNYNSQGSTTEQGEEMYSVKYSATTVNPKEYKRVVIIEGSPRRGGNTDLLADEFARGAKEAGGSVYKYFLDDFDLKFFGEGDQQRMGQSPMESTADYAIEGFRGFTKCIPNPTERGYVKAIGMGAKGAVKGTKFMTEAYELGLSINK